MFSPSSLEFPRCFFFFSLTNISFGSLACLVFGLPFTLFPGHASVAATPLLCAMRESCSTPSSWWITRRFFPWTSSFLVPHFPRNLFSYSIQFIQSPCLLFPFFDEIASPVPVVFARWTWPFPVFGLSPTAFFFFQSNLARPPFLPHQFTSYWKFFHSARGLREFFCSCGREMRLLP